MELADEAREALLDLALCAIDVRLDLGERALSPLLLCHRRSSLVRPYVRLHSLYATRRDPSRARDADRQ